MENRLERAGPALLLLSCALFSTSILLFRPALFTDPLSLGGIVFIQVVVAAIWRFQQRFFALLMLCFLFAGTGIPPEGAWLTARWVVLGIGAVVGFVVYVKQRDLHFKAFHLAALICVISAIVSALVSDSPAIAESKALSLLMLFTYAAAGGRLALVRKKDQFFPVLLAVAEFGTYLTATAYLVFRFPFLGNPNSLGAIMGTVCVPVLLWGSFVAETKPERSRRTFAFGLALLLVLFSQSRASILGCVAACVLFCLAMRRYKLLVLGSVLALMLALLAVTLTPIEDKSADLPVRHGGTLTSFFLYKGHDADGLFGSRKTPWQETLSVIQQHPWFGSGFGTDLSVNPFRRYADDVESPGNITREHGNSYLAILNWVGLLGVLPFACLLLFVAMYAARALLWLHRTQNRSLCCVPVAMIVVAGLIDVAFEDWLFAVGYYLSVFFWVMAFALVDFLRTDYCRKNMSVENRMPPSFGSAEPSLQRSYSHSAAR
jgi:O-antigen ligase